MEPPAAETIEDHSMRILEYAVSALAAVAALLLAFVR